MDSSKLINTAEGKLKDAFARIDDIALQNQKRVLDAMRQHRVTEEYFAEKTGYGRNDAGRQTIDNVYATVFGAQAAAVRMQFVSGTHAIACALMGNLKAGDLLVSLTGTPYDTLKEVIGIAGNEPGNLISAGINYIETELDFGADEGSWSKNIAQAISFSSFKKSGDLAAKSGCMFYIQKSCGYSTARPTLANAQIANIIAAARSVRPESIVFVDNCYGEFVEKREPTAVGANLVAGSLIKNPGGGLAIAGGYIAGDGALVSNAMNRLTAPGIGGHLGLTYNQNRLVLQGFFLAPSVVASAVKGAMLIAQLLGDLGCKVFPPPDRERYDIIQAVEFGKPEHLVNFCRAIQRGSPVNAHVVPEPSLMPGYQDPVIMAAGTFIEGATIELSADGPLRPPYAAFVQGGLTYLHVKCVMEEAVSLSTSGDLPFF